MKKALVVLLVLSVALMSVFANGAKESVTTTKETLTLWTYPVGDWGNDAAVTALMDAFKAETGI